MQPLASYCAAPHGTYPAHPREKASAEKDAEKRLAHRPALSAAGQWPHGAALRAAVQLYRTVGSHWPPRRAAPGHALPASPAGVAHFLAALHLALLPPDSEDGNPKAHGVCCAHVRVVLGPEVGNLEGGARQSKSNVGYCSAPGYGDGHSSPTSYESLACCHGVGSVVPPQQAAAASVKGAGRSLAPGCCADNAAVCIQPWPPVTSPASQAGSEGWLRAPWACACCSK
jgi:hypothetical protein